MTQAQLSHLLVVPQNVVARLEDGGRADPRFSTIVALARALGVSIDTLAAEAGLIADAPNETALQKRLLDTARLAKAARLRLAELDEILVQFEPAAPTKRRKATAATRARA